MLTPDRVAVEARNITANVNLGMRRELDGWHPSEWNEIGFQYAKEFVPPEYSFRLVTGVGAKPMIVLTGRNARHPACV